MKRIKRTLSILAMIGLLYIGLVCAAHAEEPAGRCPDLSVCGGLVWHVDGEAILCEDVEAGKVAASLALSGLYDAGQQLKSVSLASWTPDSVIVTLALRDAEGDASLRLAELGLNDGAVSIIKVHDPGDRLDFLADDAWYEVDTVGYGQGLFIAALDADYLFHFYAFAPENGVLTPLGERGLDSTIAVLPYDGDVLVVGPDPMDDGLLELTRLSLADGTQTLLDSVRLDSAVRASNFTWDDSRTQLYYTVNNTVYVLVPGSGEAPKAVGMLSDMPAQLRLGALAGDRYVALGEKGQLLSCDIRTPAPLQARLRIANIAGDEAVIEAARDFGVVHSGCSVSIADAVTEADLLPDVRARASDYDAFVLPLESGLYVALREAGLMADLSGSPALSSAATDMTRRMAQAIQSEGRLLAMPMAAGNFCQTLNVPAVQALTGLSPEAMPTDWPGFFALLERLADIGALTADGEYCLYDADISGDALRDMIFGWMLQDCLLWARADETAIERLPGAMLPAIEAFDRVDWSRLATTDGLSSSGQWSSASGGLQFEQGGSGRTALLSDGMLDIVVSPQSEGMEPWPLSVQPGGERLIGQVATVICVNPDSDNPEAALAFVAHAWEKTEVESKMALCQSMNAPIANDAYRTDLGYMAQDVAMLKQGIAAARSGAERNTLQADLAQLQAYMEDYRKNGQWIASEASISRYRGFADALVPIPPDFDFNDAQYDLTVQFLDGALTPEEFADRFIEAIK